MVEKRTTHTSTSTEPMETGEGALNELDTEDFAENQVPESFEQVDVKPEPAESEVAGHEETSMLEGLIKNGHVESSPTNEAFTPVENGHVKEEQAEDKEDYKLC